ncbi:Protein yippee-like [Hibiscus syriacus]|uniref:Protein yippee-like n=1 Tax=Hibiscus syriacus TaxID=106335 RepID=A0A6A3CHL9_HIBSY|nr:protein yippee-like At4g27740 [Hibiscus syriacus]KAE8727002.1 Protein yippee-like [Hibiscus syriacus]
MESGGNPLYRCSNCRNPLALVEDLLSKNFIAKSGKAYMFRHAMNVVLGPKYDTQMITGRYTVADVFCSKCNERLGWKYVQSYDMKNRYKEGTFILEELKMFQQY